MKLRGYVSEVFLWYLISEAVISSQSKYSLIDSLSDTSDVVVQIYL